MRIASRSIPAFLSRRANSVLCRNFTRKRLLNRVTTICPNSSRLWVYSSEPSLAPRDVSQRFALESAPKRRICSFPSREIPSSFLWRFLPSPILYDKKQNLISQLQVIEYLSKKGYNRTEAMLRTESARHDADGRPVTRRAEDDPARQYQTGMGKSFSKLVPAQF